MKRKDFIKNTIPIAVIPSLLKPFSVRVFGDSPMLLQMLNAFVETDKVLVLVQLNGGNDGLNTVIPIDQYSAYVNARSNIAIPQSNILSLTGVNNTGLHPSMTGMQQLYNQGELRIVQAVGYPNPNFSHFRSTDIWMSASDSDKVLTTGWAGRYLADQYPDFPTGYPNTNAPDPLGIQIGSITSLATQGPSANMAISISSTSNFYNLINGVEESVPNTPAGEALKYVRLIAKQTNAYATRITDAAATVTQQGTYPTNNSLADQLKIVARLVKGGLKTRVYMVSIGGFDTHASQTNTTDPLTGTHANLLRRVSDAIKAFQDDLKFMGVADRVIGMTFSEFGRRIRSNGSIGTDHGAAAPMFIFGTKVNPGITGVNPNIPANPLVNDNVPMQYDFRSVYASILKDWFCADTMTLENTLLNNFQSLPLCASGNCSITPVTDSRVPGISLISNYPNPFTSSTTIRFTTKGAHTMVQIMDAQGRVIRTLFDQHINAGDYTVLFDAHALPAGLYYMRFQNGIAQQVKPMIKVR
ncbi:MAG: DUF1501 domain-containing protein [Bacteroidota bacterium]